LLGTKFVLFTNRQLNVAHICHYVRFFVMRPAAIAGYCHQGPVLIQRYQSVVQAIDK